jgi:RNA polymerase sigma-70 factor (ECF subfamily)
MGSAVDDDAVGDAWRQARARWPAVQLDEAAYREFVAARAAAGATAGDDLYLACACARGDDAAVKVFEAEYFGVLDAVLRKERRPDLRDELAQRVRLKLFVQREDGARAIASYSGSGPLRRWFRMTCARALINLLSRHPPETPASDELIADVLGGDADPELEYIKVAYRRDFRAAFAACFAELADRDRSLLRDAFREGKSIDVLAVAHGVHRSTVARWIVSAHQSLVTAIRARLMRDQKMSPAEVDSLFQLVFSRMEITLGDRVG